MSALMGPHVAESFPRCGRLVNEGVSTALRAEKVAAGAERLVAIDLHPAHRIRGPAPQRSSANRAAKITSADHVQDQLVVDATEPKMSARGGRGPVGTAPAG